MINKLPPHDLDAEGSVLGSILLDQQAHEVIPYLDKECFYLPIHQIIFEAIRSLYNSSKPIDLVTIASELSNTGNLEKIGGRTFLNKMLDDTPCATNADYYAKIVRDKYIARKIIQLADQTKSIAYEDSSDVAELLDVTSNRLGALTNTSTGNTTATMVELMRDAYKRIKHLSDHRGELTGIPTGINGVDALLCGLQPSDLIIIASRPSMGKTSLGLAWAINAARNGVPSMFFSLEMDKSQIANRIISMESGVPIIQLRTGNLSLTEMDFVVDAMSKINSTNILIDDSAMLTVNQIRARTRKAHNENGIGMVVVDYLQLIAPMSDKGKSREREVAEISAGLKALAKELKVPVVALSQLSRSLESRTGPEGKRPVLSDLRDSGGIEQDADVVVFIYRDEYYNRDSQDKGFADIMIKKQRNGPIGDVKVRFIKHLTKFEDAVQPNKFDYKVMSYDTDTF